LTVVVLLAFAIAILILFECELTCRLGIDQQQRALTNGRGHDLGFRVDSNFT
jgi:hypothetical protein